MGGKGGGKGSGGAPPPPPSGEEAKKRKAEAAEKERLRKEQDKAKLARMKEIEAQQRDLAGRLSSCKPCSIEGTDWSKLSLMVHLVGGRGQQTSGVRVMEFGESEGVVMKRTQDPTSEWVAQNVANCLGVRVAQFRMVHPTDAEWNVIDENLTRIEQNPIDWKFINDLKERACEETKIMLDRYTDELLVTQGILEFVPGPTLDTAVGSLASPAESLMRGLGSLAVLDLLLNNFDRLPLTVWDSEVGNLTNVVVVEEGQGAVGIDQQVNLILDKGGMEEYLHKASNLATQLMKENYAHTSLQAASLKLRSAFNTAVGVEPPSSSTTAILKGMREQLLKLPERLDSGALREALAKAVETGGAIVEKKGGYPPQHYADFVLAVAEELAPVIRQEAPAAAERKASSTSP